jgi:hypothetical protein
MRTADSKKVKESSRLQLTADGKPFRKEEVNVVVVMVAVAPEITLER